MSFCLFKPKIRINVLSYKFSARYSTIVQYQLLYHHHGCSQGPLGPWYPKCSIFKNSLIRMNSWQLCLLCKTLLSCIQFRFYIIMQNHQSNCIQWLISTVISQVFFNNLHLDRKCSTDAVVQVMVSINYISLCMFGQTEFSLLTFADCLTNYVPFQDNVCWNKQRLWCNKCTMTKNMWKSFLVCFNDATGTTV